MVEELQQLFPYALKLTGNHADAEDLLQDTYIKAAVNPNTSKVNPLGAWLNTIMYRTHLNRERYRRKRRAVSMEDLPGYDPACPPRHEALCDLVTTLDQLSRLDTEKRQIMSMLIAGDTNADMQTQLGLTRSQVQKRIRASRFYLRDKQKQPTY